MRRVLIWEDGVGEGRYLTRGEIYPGAIIATCQAGRETDAKVEDLVEYCDRSTDDCGFPLLVGFHEKLAFMLRQSYSLNIVEDIMWKIACRGGLAEMNLSERDFWREIGVEKPELNWKMT